MTYPDGSADPTDLFTVSEVAGSLRVTERYVRKLIAVGDLPAVKIGSRAVRIRRANVDALLRPIVTGDDAA